MLGGLFLMQHLILLQLIKAQWWSRKGEAKRLGSREDNNSFINTPITMMALVVTAVGIFLHCKLGNTS